MKQSMAAEAGGIVNTKAMMVCFPSRCQCQASILADLPPRNDQHSGRRAVGKGLDSSGIIALGLLENMKLVSWHDSASDFPSKSHMSHTKCKMW